MEELRASLLTVTFPKFLVVFMFVIRRRTTRGRLFASVSSCVNRKLYDDMRQFDERVDHVAGMGFVDKGHFTAAAAGARPAGDGDRDTAIAGKPAPTGARVYAGVRLATNPQEPAPMCRSTRTSVPVLL